MTADIWMPHFGLKAHGRRAERVVGRDDDVNVVSTAFIWSSGGSRKRASEMREIISINGFSRDLRMRVRLNVGEFLGHATHPIASHDDFQRGNMEMVIVDESAWKYEDFGLVEARKRLFAGEAFEEVSSDPNAGKLQETC